MLDKQHTVTVQLEQPIARGKDDKRQVIESVTLRRPMAGELRGTNLTDLLQMNVDAMFEVLPRIANPMLTREDLRVMPPSDITALAMEVTGFLTRKAPSQG